MLGYVQNIFIKKKVIEKYQLIGKKSLDLWWRYLGSSWYIVTSLLGEWGSQTNNVKSAFFVKTGKTNVVVKWRIMDTQPKLGSGLGTLLGHRFKRQFAKYINSS